MQGSRTTSTRHMSLGARPPGRPQTMTCRKERFQTVTYRRGRFRTMTCWRIVAISATRRVSGVRQTTTVPHPARRQLRANNAGTQNTSRGGVKSVGQYPKIDATLVVAQNIKKGGPCQTRLWKEQQTLGPETGVHVKHPAGTIERHGHPTSRQDFRIHSWCKTGTED